MIKKWKNWIGFTAACLLFSCSSDTSTSQTKKMITISTESEPQSFDPRQVRGLSEKTALNALYEGLMCLNDQGQVALGMAESYATSEDGLRYLFKIRKSQWSDGQPVTAHDFAESWKSQLQPDFPAPNSYQLFIIKGAQEAKEGKLAVSQVAVQALDDHTLAIELCRPVPYFLELLATHFFFPLSLADREEKKEMAQKPITNGPFTLTTGTSNEWNFSPNPYYWNRPAIKVDGIKLVKLDNMTALKLFQQGELDWAGSPLSTLPNDALSDLRKKEMLQTQAASGVYFLRVNTAHPFLDHPKMRRALALALNRADLVNALLQEKEMVMHRYVPNQLLSKDFYQDNEGKAAQELFKEVLQQSNLNGQTIKIGLCYANNPRSHQIAQVIEQQWKEKLGVEVELQSCEGKAYYDRLKNQAFEVSIGSWFADIDDPISFLEVFKWKNNGTNNTQWENASYIDLLERSSLEPKQTRSLLLLQAEEILMDEMPLIPLFQASYSYLKKPNLQGIFFSKLGYLDFKQADYQEEPPLAKPS